MLNPEQVFLIDLANALESKFNDMPSAIIGDYVVWCDKWEPCHVCVYRKSKMILSYNPYVNREVYWNGSDQDLMILSGVVNMDVGKLLLNSM